MKFLEDIFETGELPIPVYYLPCFSSCLFGLNIEYCQGSTGIRQCPE